MRYIRNYQVLPQATGPLTLLESITEVPDRQVTKTGQSLCIHHSSTTMAEAIQRSKHEQHQTVGIAPLLIVILAKSI